MLLSSASIDPHRVRDALLAALALAAGSVDALAWLALGLLGTAFMQLAFWIVWLAVRGDPGSTLMVVLLAISALAMGIQTATAVALGVHAVFTAAVTATWSVLAGDAAHWSRTRIERRRLTMVLGGTLIGALAGALLLTHARLWMPLLPALLTAGVAVVARYRLERCTDATRTTVSSAPHPSTRAFGRTAHKAGAVSHGR